MSSTTSYLHRVLGRGDWDLARTLLKSEDALGHVRRRSSDRTGWYERCGVLEQACDSDAPIDVLRSIHELDPRQVVGRTESGDTLLHSALLRRPSSSVHVVSFLLEAAPETAATPGWDGGLPLENALFRNAPPSVVHELLSVHPTAVYASNKCCDQTPFDFFFRTKMTQARRARMEDTFFLLMKAYKYGVRYSDAVHERRNTSMVLEVLKMKNISPEFVISLMNTMPEEWVRSDDDGNSPLHLITLMTA